MYFCNGFQQRLEGEGGRWGWGGEGRKKRRRRKKTGVRHLCAFSYANEFRRKKSLSSPQLWTNPHYIYQQLTFCFVFVNLVGRPLFVPGSAICLISTSEVLFHITAPHLYATEVIWSHSTPKHKIKVLFS